MQDVLDSLACWLPPLQVGPECGSLAAAAAAAAALWHLSEAAGDQHKLMLGPGCAHPLYSLWEQAGINTYEGKPDISLSHHLYSLGHPSQ